jgi:hypothetical protein
MPVLAEIAPVGLSSQLKPVKERYEKTSDSIQVSCLDSLSNKPSNLQVYSRLD